MIVYHGSYMEIRKPDLAFSKRPLDFGKGFYTTTILSQAEDWCQKFIRQGKRGIVSSYHVDGTVFKQYQVKTFDSYSEDWLDFIVSCRRDFDDTDYDIVVGGIANDKVFNTIELYLVNLIPKEETIRRLKYEKPNQQICFRNQQLMDEHINFQRSVEI